MEQAQLITEEDDNQISEIKGMTTPHPMKLSSLTSRGGSKKVLKTIIQKNIDV